MIAYRCKACGYVGQAAERYAGQRLACPRCPAEVVIPGGKPRRSLVGCLGIVAGAVLVAVIASAIISRSSPLRPGDAQPAGGVDAAADAIAAYGAPDRDELATVAGSVVRTLTYRRATVRVSFVQVAEPGAGSSTAYRWRQLAAVDTITGQRINAAEVARRLGK